MNKKNTATSFQLFAIICGAVIGNGVFSLPRLVAAEAGRDAWLVIMATGAILSIVALLGVVLASKFPHMDGAEWPKALLGTVLGRMWMSLYLIRTLAVTLLTAKLFAGTISVRLLPFTPTVATIALVTLLASLAVLCKLSGLLRSSEMIYYLTAPVFLFALTLVFQGHTFQLLPMLRDVNALNLAKGALPAAYSFVGFDVLWFVYPYLHNKQAAKGVVLVSMGFVTVTYTLVTALSVMLFGLERLGTLFAPTLALLTTPEFVLFERTDSLTLFIWLGTVVMTAAVQLYISVRLLQGLWPKLSYAKTTVFLGAALLAGGWMENPLRVVVDIATAIGQYDLLFISLSTVLLLILAIWRERGENHEAQASD